jgi:hypothetical protein
VGEEATKRYMVFSHIASSEANASGDYLRM